MISTLTNLTTTEQQAVNTFLKLLSSTFGETLHQVWLFGSKARGDFHAESDVDLLIVLNEYDSEKRHQVRKLGAQCSLEYDILFNTHILTNERWYEIVHHKDTLWREIQRDGILLLENVLVH